jgi:hypothetical protein
LLILRQPMRPFGAINHLSSQHAIRFAARLSPEATGG